MTTPDLSVPNVLRVLWRGRHGLFGLALATGVVALLVSTLIPRTYTAEAVMVMDHADMPLGTPQAAPSALDQQFRTATQAEILRSQALISEVVRDLDLASNPKIMTKGALIAAKEALAPALSVLRQSAADWLPGTSRAAPRPERVPDLTTVASAVVSKNLQVWPSDKSAVIRILFTSADPDLSAQVANLLIEKYLAAQLRARAEMVASLHRALSERLDAARREMEEADQSVQDFRRSNNLFETGGGEIAALRLAELQSLLITAQAEEKELHSRVAATAAAVTSGRDAGSQDLLASPVVQRLREQETAVGGAFAALSERMGAKHPDILARREELSNTRLQIVIESRKVLQSLRSALAGAQERTRRLERGIAEAQAAARTSSVEDVTLQGLLGQAVEKRKVYQSYMTRLQQVTDAQLTSLPAARIASAATPPLGPNGMGPLLAGPFGGIFGLLLGAGILVARDANRRRIYSSEELADVTGFPRLGEIPDGDTRRKGDLPDLVLRAPLDAASESARGLLAGVRSLSHVQRSCVLMVTSTVPGEGKTSLVLALGRIAAMDGVRTVVVDCDFRMPAVARALGVPREPGPSAWIDEALQSGSTPMIRLSRDARTGLAYLPAAGTLDNPQSALSSARFDDVIRSLRREFDLILLDTPPVFNVSDSVTLARHADLLFYAAAWGRTPHRLIREGVERLNLRPEVRAFSVLTRVKPSKVATGYYRGYPRKGRATAAILPGSGRTFGATPQVVSSEQQAGPSISLARSDAWAQP